MINVNLNSVFILCQEAARVMLPKGYGKMILVSSMNAFFGGQNIPAYAAAKGGLTAMAKEMSNDWLAKGINVNCIAPGPFHSDLDADLPASFLEQIDRDMPMHRFGMPIELGAYCVFLASPAARMVTGAVCVSDGGLTCAIG